jgi:L-type amino acid transporter 9
LALVNCYSVKLASKMMVVFTTLKVLAVVFIAVVGIIFMIIRGVPENFKHPFDTVPGLEPNVVSAALSLYGVLWAYSGW